MGESADTRDLCRDIEAMNGMTYPLVAGRYQPPGWPDRFICHRFWTGFIEFKGPKTPIEPIQQLRIRELNARQPGLAVVVRLPCRIETERGELLAEFDGSAKDLLAKLRGLRDAADTNLGT